MQKLFLLALVCLSPHLFAQRSFFGVDAGINIANQKTVEITSSPTSYSVVKSFGHNVVKPTLGAFYQFGLPGNFALRLGAQYMSMGTRSNGEELEINYLTLPLTVHYSIYKKLSFNTGVYLSFTLGGTKVNNQPITKTYHQNDRGLNFGAEYEVYKNVAVGVNYVVGFMNIWLADKTTDPISNATTGTTVNNRALQFTLIYKFKKP